MPFLLRTPRLYLREMQPDDAPHACRLNADPEVLRYTGDAPFADEAAARLVMPTGKTGGNGCGM